MNKKSLADLFIISRFECTGGPLIGRKNGSIFLTNRLMRTVNKMAVLWEELENLLNKPKPSYREIRPMRGRLMRGLPVVTLQYKCTFQFLLRFSNLAWISILIYLKKCFQKIFSQIATLSLVELRILLPDLWYSKK